MESPAFKRWFGDSRVVDERGEPQIVWHSSDAGPFDVFDRARVVDVGFHFGTEAAARDLSSVGTARPFYLRIINPIELTDPGDWFTKRSYATMRSIHDQLDEKGLLSRDQHERIAALIEQSMAIRKATSFHSAAWRETRSEMSGLLRSILLAQGFDGVRYENLVEGPGDISWIAFDPQQIKSATANVGTYDPEDPSVLKNPRAEVRVNRRRTSRRRNSKGRRNSKRR